MMKAQRLGVIFFLVLIGAFLLTESGALAAWAPKGPAGTSVQSLFCSGNTPGVIFAGTNGGVFKTSGTGTDYGAAWTFKGFRNRWIHSMTSTGLTGNPCGSSLVIAAERDMYLSEDGGNTWTFFISLPDNIKSMTFRSSSCTGYVGTGNGVYNTFDNGRYALAGHEITALTVDSNGNVYAGTEDNGVYRTTDNGANGEASWSQFGLAGAMVTSLTKDGNGNVFAGTVGGGVYMYPNGGPAWVQKASGLPVFQETADFYAVMSLIKSNGVLYAGLITGAPITGAVYKSSNNGTDWEILDGLDGSSPESLCATPENNNLFVGTNNGIYRIDLINPNPVTTPRDQTGLISAAPFRNAFVSLGSDIFVGTDSMGVYKSSDQGETWAKAWTGTKPPQLVNGLVSDALGNMYVSDGNISGIYKSTDSGLSWTLASTGLPTMDFFGYTMFIEGTALGIDAAGNIYTGLDDGRIYKSINQADNWNATADTSTTNTISSLSGGGPRDTTTNTMYAGTQGNGVIKTTDGGATWGSFSTGLPGNSRIFERSFYMDGATGDLYAGIEGNGLYRTTDTGNNWNKVAVLLPGSDPSHCSNNEVHAVTIDQSRNLYAMICSGGVYVSGSMGTTWIDISGGLPPLDSLEGVQGQGVYTDSANNILAATGSRGMWKYAKEYAKKASAADTYATILEACNSVSTGGDIVQLLALNFSENLDLQTISVPFTLKGGHGTGFGPIIGFSTIKGSLTIRQGSVTIENIVII